ncbi:DUF2637 domain-containing protein [Nocardia bovistercoris]|uniref:DUF2637 domain-containing protein n=1 Tax=Nocardia bovistercoris TaxID=2785916 RepID=A0A931I7Y7_9NOCA|nr:DUF2637 domain-containing protein [Nocardia bovistercoris]MBH0775053.1 DUF2637 domain-containing protein [Nocardia bovistercoris]
MTTNQTGAQAVHTPTATHRNAPTTVARTREETSAIRFFWGELLLVAAMSIAGNIVHAWLNAPPGKQWVAAFVASFPPIALLAATHGVGLLVRAQNKARLAYWAVVALTAAIAAIAFRLSFDALRELSIQVGMSEHLAFLFPLIIDGAIGQATVALLVLARTDRTDPEPTARTEHEPVRTPEPVHAVSVREVRTEIQSTTSQLTTEPDRTEIDRSQRTAIEPLPHQPRTDEPEHLDTWAAVAQQLCAADPAGRRDPDTVTTILRLKHEQGYTHSQIAERIEVSKSTVTRTLIAAREITEEGTL